MQKPTIVVMAMLVAAMMLTIPLRAERQASPSTMYVDELDQYQNTTSVSVAALPVGRISGTTYCIQLAQSFIPTKAVLTRVQLLAGKNTTTTLPMTVCIRQELTGDNLSKVDVPADHFISLNYSWVDIDVPDCWVEPGTTYYIVCLTQNITDNYYAWGVNNESESYLYGCLWYSADGFTWNSTSAPEPELQTLIAQKPVPASDETWDTCFRTYGLTEATLDYKFTGTKLTITNTGNVTAQDVYWNITYTGGIILLGRHVNGTLAVLEPGTNTVVRNLVLGIGPIIIQIQAGAANARPINQTATGFLFLFFILGIK